MLDSGKAQVLDILILMHYEERQILSLSTFCKNYFVFQ